MANGTKPIRCARLADIPRLSEIRAAVIENRLSDPAMVREEDYARFIGRRACWLWEEKGAIAGFCALDVENGSLWALFVDPQAQGRGIGRSLLDRAVSEATSATLPELSLTTSPGTRAGRLYRSAGWRWTGLNPEGELILRLSLTVGRRSC